MRKLATFAALTLSTGTVLIGAASAATAGINLGDQGPDAASTPTAGSLDFANNFCGAPWQWTAPQNAGTCANRHHGDAAGQ